MRNTGGLDGRGGINRTICQIHREIYQELIKDNLDKGIILFKLKEAFECGKKMSNRLRMYKDDLSQYWYNNHKLDGGELNEV